MAFFAPKMRFGGELCAVSGENGALPEFRLD